MCIFSIVKRLLVSIEILQYNSHEKMNFRNMIISRDFVNIIDLRHRGLFPKEINPRLTKRPLETNGRLANHGLTSLVKEATDNKLDLVW